ncbi:hypothetical protein FRC12_022461 [Ceratobasidium sp. 428]|nr:hypothetical protein FRC12_022461 [Ceratobasidium sp. 428]
MVQSDTQATHPQSTTSQVDPPNSPSNPVLSQAHPAPSPALDTPNVTAHFPATETTNQVALLPQAPTPNTLMRSLLGIEHLRVDPGN